MNNEAKTFNSMKINLLGIETATHECSVALYTQNKIVERSIYAPQQHNKLILPMIDELLAEAQLSSEQIHGIAFGQGPGSFTGIRLAMSIAQTIAFGVNGFLIPISTLQALAQQAWRVHRATHVLAALDARLNQIYWGYYAVNTVSSLMEVCKRETLSRPEKMQRFFMNALSQQSEDRGIGNGWNKQQDHVISAQWIAGCFPKAYDVVTLALHEYEKGNTLSLNTAHEPLYLHNPVILN